MKPIPRRRGKHYDPTDYGLYTEVRYRIWDSYDNVFMEVQSTEPLDVLNWIAQAVELGAPADRYSMVERRWYRTKRYDGKKRRTTEG